MLSEAKVRLIGHCMRIGSLKLFEEIRHQDQVGPSKIKLIAAWHPIKSITWKWLLSWQPRDKDTHLGFYNLRQCKGHAFMGWNSKLFGCIHFQKQPLIKK